MLTRFILIGFLVTPFFGLAQSRVENREIIQSPVWFRASCMGSMIYPGVALGMEYPLKTKYYRNGLDSARMAKIKQRSLTANLSWYHHKNYHDNFIFSTGYLLRRTNRRGWFTDIEPQLGTSRTFVGGSVYTVDATNNVQQKKFVGDWFLATKLSFSVGKDFFYASSHSVPLKIYMRPSFIMILPYNNFIYVRPTLEIGVLYSFKNAWMVKSQRVNCRQTIPK